METCSESFHWDPSYDMAQMYATNSCLIKPAEECYPFGTDCANPHMCYGGNESNETFVNSYSHTENDVVNIPDSSTSNSGFETYHCHSYPFYQNYLNSPHVDPESILVNVHHAPFLYNVRPIRTCSVTSDPPSGKSNPEDMDLTFLDSTVSMFDDFDMGIPEDLDLDTILEEWGDSFGFSDERWKIKSPSLWDYLDGPYIVDEHAVLSFRNGLYGKEPSREQLSSVLFNTLLADFPHSLKFDSKKSTSNLLAELLGNDFCLTIPSQQWNAASPSSVPTLCEQSPASTTVSVASSPSAAPQLERVKQWERKCTICGILIIGGGQRYDAHVKNTHELMCTCGEKFMHKTKLNNHIKSRAAIGESLGHKHIPGDKIKDIFECDFCEELFHNRAKAFNHRQKHLIALNIPTAASSKASGPKRAGKQKCSGGPPAPKLHRQFLEPKTRRSGKPVLGPSTKTPSKPNGRGRRANNKAEGADKPKVGRRTPKVIAPAVPTSEPMLQRTSPVVRYAPKAENEGIVTQNVLPLIIKTEKHHDSGEVLPFPVATITTSHLESGMSGYYVPINRVSESLPLRNERSLPPTLPVQRSVIQKASSAVSTLHPIGIGSGKGKRLEMAKPPIETQVEEEVTVLFSSNKSKGWRSCDHNQRHPW